MRALGLRAYVVAVAALLGLAPAAAADLLVDGRGFGHGVGMSQFGAFGLALREGRSFRSILAHYYTGTSVGSAPTARMRVRLKEAGAPKVCGANRLRGGDGRRVRLNDAHGYRVRASGAARLRVIDTTTDRTRARVASPARFTGGHDVCLRGAAENNLSNGRYRGALVLSRAGDRVLTVNDVRLEAYLYGVVPSEMPTSWPRAAVRSQAVVARSFALRSRRPDRPFDVFADVRSQVYRGVDAETPEGTAAVRATRELVVTFGGEVALTLFFSTSGGRTASNEEAFGTTPVPYLRSVADPHDDISPVHTWTERISSARAARRLRSVTEGDLEDVEVVARGPSGRAATVRVTGSEGVRDVGAATIRTLLELRSTWFTLTFTP